MRAVARNIYVNDISMNNVAGRRTGGTISTCISDVGSASFSLGNTGDSFSTATRRVSISTSASTTTSRTLSIYRRNDLVSEFIRSRRLGGNGITIGVCLSISGRGATGVVCSGDSRLGVGTISGSLREGNSDFSFIPKRRNGRISIMGSICTVGSFLRGD